MKENLDLSITSSFNSFFLVCRTGCTQRNRVNVGMKRMRKIFAVAHDHDMMPVFCWVLFFSFFFLSHPSLFMRFRPLFFPSFQIHLCIFRPQGWMDGSGRSSRTDPKKIFGPYNQKGRGDRDRGDNFQYKALPISCRERKKLFKIGFSIDTF